MKKALLFLGILLISTTLKAQLNNYAEPEKKRPKFYLGIGTGMNSYTGFLGASANYLVNDKLFIQGGVGLSMWGYRTSLGLLLNKSNSNGFTFGIGLSNSSGLNEIEIEFTNNNGTTETKNMRLFNASTFNIKTGYNWWIGEKSTFYIDFGYAIAFEQQPWRVNDGTTLSATNQQVLEILAPGGVMLGLGFTFGI